MKPAHLLSWYPRAWRERYGEELLALIQDNLQEGRPAWPLQLSVIWGGLRERGRQARQAATAAFKATGFDKASTILLAGLICGFGLDGLTTASSAARPWQAVALDAVLAAVALTGALVLADGLVAFPALVRFLRAGGWPKIRRRVAWAGGATVVAAGSLAGLVLIPGSRSPAQLEASWAYSAGFVATGLAIAVAIGSCATAAEATAKHLTLAPRLRTVQLMLVAVSPTAVTVTLVTLNLWWSATQSPLWLVAVPLFLGPAILGALLRLRVASRKGRRLRAAASGRTNINPSAERTNGRHRA